MLLILTIHYGLGAGSVDTALNNFVALHYKAKHMNWLHSFWGVGATLGPYIMGYVLLQGFTWNQGYLTISLLQATLFGILLFTLPIWKKAQQQSAEEALHVPIRRLPRRDSRSFGFGRSRPLFRNVQAADA